MTPPAKRRFPNRLSRKIIPAFYKRLTNVFGKRHSMGRVSRLMESHSTITSNHGRMLQIGKEMDKLFQRQIELMKSETFVGLTPLEHQEYERIAEKLSGLFRELARLKRID
jgi:hypothetical protein